LATNQEAGGIANFSQASEIVELVVLSQDDSTLKTLREVVGGSLRLWHVTAADKISDLLVAGDVGIVILDAQELGAAAPRFIGEIIRQFPDLVILVAGDREAQTALAGLVSAGAVYRFIHKPLSPGRARLFVDAAVRRFGRQRPPPPPPAPVPRSGNYRVAALLAAALVLAVVAWYWMSTAGPW
jgi:DNA-binding NtrC family response regulator